MDIIFDILDIVIFAIIPISLVASAVKSANKRHKEESDSGEDKQGFWSQLTEEFKKELAKDSDTAEMFGWETEETKPLKAEPKRNVKKANRPKKIADVPSGSKRPSAQRRRATTQIAINEANEKAAKKTADVINNVSVDVKADPKTKTVSANVRDESKAAWLKRAVIAKEILDKPVSMRK